MKKSKKKPLENMTVFAVQVRCADGQELLRIFDKQAELAAFLQYMKIHKVRAAAWQM